MLATSDPDRIDIAFDDDRLVADAGLLLPATLAQHLGLQELADSYLDLGDAPGRANAGDKLLTLVASALAGGECIDDAAALRAGGTASVLGCTVKAPSTLGVFLRSFSWGHVRQLDRVSRKLLARAWAAGAGPGDAPLTIDLDSTLCETYGLAKEGARQPGYTGARGYHPLLAVAAGTGDVLMARLREGRANSARGAAHFLRETVGRVRAAGASGQLTMRADSGFYNHAVVAVCRKQDVRFSITIRQQPNVRRRQAAREMGISRNTVRRYLTLPEPVRVEREPRRKPVLERVQPRLDALLEEWSGRTTAKQIGMRAGLLLTADTRLRREHGLDGPGSGSARSLREVGDRPCSRIAQRRGALRARMGPPLPSASTWATATHTSTRSAPAARCCASGASAPRRRRWAQH